MKTVVFDIDGVLAEFEPYLVACLENEFGSLATKGRNMYHFQERFAEYPYILEKAEGIQADPNIYYCLEPNPAAVKLVCSLIELGYGVLYVSARPKYTETYTRRWLEKHTGCYKHSLGLWCGIENKADYLSDIDVDFVVEDSPDQIQRLREFGIPYLCWGQEWNSGIFPRLVTERQSDDVFLWESESTPERPFLQAV